MKTSLLIYKMYDYKNKSVELYRYYYNTVNLPIKSL